MAQEPPKKSRRSEDRFEVELLKQREPGATEREDEWATRLGHGVKVVPINEFASSLARLERTGIELHRMPWVELDVDGVVQDEGRVLEPFA